MLAASPRSSGPMKRTPTVRAAGGDAGVGLLHGKIASGGRGSTYSDETNPGGQGFSGHHGHVHTTFNRDPFTGTPYTPYGGQGVKAGTNTALGEWSAFPPWVKRLGDMYGLDAKTYPNHQEWDGANHGIDWYPRGKLDMSGKSYTHQDHVTLSNFAAAGMAVGTGQGTFGGAVPLGLGSSGAPGSPGELGSPGGPSGATTAGPAPTAEGGGAGTGTGPLGPVGTEVVGTGGAGQLPRGLTIPSTFTDPNPYTNLPANIHEGSPAYAKYKSAWDTWYDNMQKANTRISTATTKADQDDGKVTDAKQKEAAARIAWGDEIRRTGGDKSPLLTMSQDQLMDNPFYKKWYDAVNELQTATDTAKTSRAAVTADQTAAKPCRRKTRTGRPERQGR